MKTIKAVYNEETAFILDIVKEFEDVAFVETFDRTFRREKKKAIELQTDYGTTNLPLVVFEDENLEGYACIWPENKPDWKKDIIKYLKYV